MSFNTKTVILMICLMSGNSLVDSQHTLCVPDVKQDTIVLAGVVHYEVVIKRSDLVEEELVEETGFLLYDVYLQAFVDGDAVGFRWYRTQAGFFLPACDDDIEDKIDALDGNALDATQTESEDVRDCRTIRQLKADLYIEFKKDPEDLEEHQFVVRFFFLMKNGIWERRFSIIETSERPETAKQLNNSEIWPNEWQKDRPDQTIMGACAYLPKRRMFMYVINGEDDTKNAVLYTRTVSDIRNNLPWTVKDIPNSAGKKFISLFYYFLDGKVYAQVKHHKTMPISLAPIYVYNPNNILLFTTQEKYKSAQDLWGCKPTPAKDSEVLIMVLMVITCVVLAITVLVICYFVFFLMIRKKADPVLGLRIRDPSQKRHLKL